MFDHSNSGQTANYYYVKKKKIVIKKGKDVEKVFDNIPSKGLLVII